jgi:hypothetical protein
MPPILKVDFFRVTMPANCTRSFNEVVSGVYGRNPAELRNFPAKEDHYIRIQEGFQGPTYYEAELVRIRMDKMPTKATLAGGVEPFQFAEDEGVGEETAFYYHLPTQILLLQYNRYGVLASTVARYFQILAQVEGEIRFDPVLREDALIRMTRMGSFRKLSLRFAGGQNAQIFQGLGYGVEAIADLINEFQAPTVEISLSMGHVRRGTLLLDAVDHTIRRVLGIAAEHPNHVAKLKISGRDEGDHEIRLIDLLHDRMTERIPVELDKNRRLSYLTRRQALQQAWIIRQDELLRMYGTPRI